MKTKRWFLAAVAGVLIGSPAFAAYDTGTSKFVLAGRNAGEFQGWTEVYFHAASGAIGYGVTRTHDAAGIAITAELGNNTQSYSAGGTVANCLQHGTSSVRFSSLAELGTVSSVDFEKELLRTGCLPGRYLLSITKGADTISLSREFNSDPDTYPVTLTFASTSNVPASGVAINIIQPYATSAGTTNASGQVNLNLAPGWYRVELNNNVTWRTFSNYLFYVGDIPGQPSVAKSFVATPIADPAMTATGAMRVQVNALQDNAPLVSARVQVGGSYFFTGSDGSVWVSNLPAATYTVSASKEGYNAQTTTKTISAGGVGVVTFQLTVGNSTGPGGGGEEEPGFPDLGQILTPEFWGDLFTYLFVPEPGTMAAWEAQWNEMKEWGPFGVINSFFDDFNNPGTVAGESALVWDWPLSLMADTPATHVYIDLRPPLAAEDPPYVVVPESRGSFIGSWIGYTRPLVGLLAWALFFVAVFHWVRPRLNW